MHYGAYDGLGHRKGNAVKHSLIVLPALLLALAIGVSGQEAITDTELLAALDTARLFESNVSEIRILIQSETPDESREAEIRLLFGEVNGETRSRIEFLRPEELAGQIYLSTLDGTYFYGPDLDFPIKTSATTEVFGDAAVAQTSGIRFADDYTVQDRRTVAADDGGELLELDLIAIDYSVAFQAATVIVDPSSLRPQSAVLFAVSGLPLYEVFYGPYETSGSSDVYAQRQRIENRLLVGRVTISEVLEVSTQSQSASLFDPTQLGDGN